MGGGMRGGLGQNKVAAPELLNY